MIAAWKRADLKPGVVYGVLYSVYDAATGECLDRERIFYADDEAGYYLRHLTTIGGYLYCWDRRTKEQATRAIPDEFREVAWERVDRAIVVRRKDEGPPPRKIRFREFL